MSFRVKLPPRGNFKIGTTRFPSTSKSGDTGDCVGQVGNTIPSSELSTPAPEKCPPLPKGVLLIRYRPKDPPVAISPISVVTDLEKFIRVCLSELDARLNHPVQIRAGASVFEILNKLAEVGLELAIDGPAPQGDIGGNRHRSRILWEVASSGHSP